MGKKARSSREGMKDIRAAAVLGDVGNVASDLLSLAEAAIYLRDAFSMRTLQNLVWRGELRAIGRGSRMRFKREWLVEDLLRECPEVEDSNGRNDSTWVSSARAASERGQTAEPVRDAPVSGAGRKRDARDAADRPRRGARSRGTSPVSASGSSRTSTAPTRPGRFFTGRRRTTGDSKR
jgi:hypothetical protein